MMSVKLTPSMLDGLPKNGPTDPIDYYRRPIVGWFYRERINLGLRMLPSDGFGRVLEIGYGAGAVQVALAPFAGELYGLDLDADPLNLTEALSARGINSDLGRGSVYALPYGSEYFDVVVCFSVFEHLTEYQRALSEVRRVLRPGGLFLLGMPAVNRAMELAFRAIGFKGIEDHHITTPESVARSFASGFSVLKSNHLQVPFSGLGMRLYYNWLLQK